MSCGDIVLHAAQLRSTATTTMRSTTKVSYGYDDDDDDDADAASSSCLHGWWWLLLLLPAWGNILGWLEYYNYKRNRPQRCPKQRPTWVAHDNDANAADSDTQMELRLETDAETTTETTTTATTMTATKAGPRRGNCDSSAFNPP